MGNPTNRTLDTEDWGDLTHYLGNDDFIEHLDSIGINAEFLAGYEAQGNEDVIDESSEDEVVIIDHIDTE